MAGPVSISGGKSKHDCNRFSELKFYPPSKDKSKLSFPNLAKYASVDGVTVLAGPLSSSYGQPVVRAPTMKLPSGNMFTVTSMFCTVVHI